MRTRKSQLAVVAALGLVGYAALRRKLRRFEIVEASMDPHLSHGDYIIARERSSASERGDIVIVAHPDIPGFDLVKRVIGLPGEAVTLANGQVHIDDQVLDEASADGPTRPDGEWQLGPDDLYVLGDNRAMSSADSRTIGPVSSPNVKWKVVARYWPLARVGRIP
jgi:signal peptidase I